MRVCYLLSGFGFTGGSMVLYSFMDKLCERGHNVYAVTPDGAVRWAPGHSDEVIRTFAAGSMASLMFEVRQGVKALLKKTSKGLLSYTQGYKWIRDTRALVRHWIESDVTIATYWTTAYASFLLSERTVPLYHMQHWEEVFCADELSRLMARLTYRLPLNLVANSTWLKEKVRERVGREATLLLPGIDTRTFYPRCDLRQKFSHVDKVRIITYYSPVDFKGWPDGVAAMRKVFAALGRGRVEWVVYGGRPKNAPDVPARFVGRVFGGHLADLYSSAHIVFMPSWYESFPLPPIEAMACGAAVVVTGTGTEDYAIDGVNALVRPARNPERLAEAILHLVCNPAEAHRLAEAGLETARKFTWDAAAERLDEILESVAKNRVAAVGVPRGELN